MVNKLALTPEFKQALPVLKTITDNGYEAYFVGGCVRNVLLDLPVNDIDIATSARPEEIKALFSRTVDVGIEHGTVMILKGDASYEITTFRTESTYGDHRRPDTVEFVSSLEEDLKRRDFTINAIAVDQEGHVYDYFNGQQDINERLIRAVGDPNERFNEDALRMMRAVRFSAQLGFEIEEQTLLAISEQVTLLKKIAIERIHVEWVKVLTADARSQAIKYMLQTKLFEQCPELHNKKMVLVYLVQKQHGIKNEQQAWSILIYYILFLLPKESTFDINSFLRQWKSSNQMITNVKSIVSYLMEPSKRDVWMVYQLGIDLAIDVEEAVAFIEGKGNIETIQTLYNALPITSATELEISGTTVIEIGDRLPGPWVGELMDKLTQDVVYGRLDNNPKALAEQVRTYLAIS